MAEFDLRDQVLRNECHRVAESRYPFARIRC